jgi:hypothetical protein
MQEKAAGEADRTRESPLCSIARADAPPAILATRQAAGLCPTSAALMVQPTRS